MQGPRPADRGIRSDPAPILAYRYPRRLGHPGTDPPEAGDETTGAVRPANRYAPRGRPPPTRGVASPDERMHCETVDERVQARGFHAQVAAGRDKSRTGEPPDDVRASRAERDLSVGCDGPSSGSPGDSAMSARFTSISQRRSSSRGRTSHRIASALFELRSRHVRSGPLRRPLVDQPHRVSEQRRLAREDVPHRPGGQARFGRDFPDGDRSDALRGG